MFSSVESIPISSMLSMLLVSIEIIDISRLFQLLGLDSLILLFQRFIVYFTQFSTCTLCLTCDSRPSARRGETWPRERRWLRCARKSRLALALTRFLSTRQKSLFYCIRNRISNHIMSINRKKSKQKKDKEDSYIQFILKGNYNKLYNERQNVAVYDYEAEFNPGDLVINFIKKFYYEEGEYLSINNTVKIEKVMDIFENMIQQSAARYNFYRNIIIKSLYYIVKYKEGLINEQVKNILLEDEELRSKKRKEFRLFIRSNEEDFVQIDTVQRVYVNLNTASKNVLEQEREGVISDLYDLLVNFTTLLLIENAGMRVRQFQSMSEKSGKGRDVYLVMHQSLKNLQHMSQKIKIKKELKLQRLQTLLDEPIDNRDRPLRIKNIFKKKLQGQEYSQQYKEKVKEIRKILFPGSEESEKKYKQEDKDELGIKKVFKIMQIKSFNYEEIIEDEELSLKDLQNYHKYLVDWKNKVQQIYQNYLRDVPSNIQENFLRLVKKTNRSEEVHPLCIKEFKRDKFRAKYFEAMEELSKQHTRLRYLRMYFPQQRRISYQFFKLRKNNSVKNKIKNSLLWRPSLANEAGRIEFFQPTERILLADIFVTQIINVAGLINNGIFEVKYFPIHNNFFLAGMQIKSLFDDSDQTILKEIDEDQQLNERPTKHYAVENVWSDSPVSLWKPPIKAIRNYFGEEIAYICLIKSLFLRYFTLQTVIGIPFTIYQLLQNNFQLMKPYFLFVLLLYSLESTVHQYIQYERFQIETYEFNHIYLNTVSAKLKQKKNQWGIYNRGIVDDNPNKFQHNERRKFFMSLIFNSITVILVFIQLAIFLGLYQIYPLLLQIDPDKFSMSLYFEIAMIVPVFIFQVFNDQIIQRIFDKLNMYMTDFQGHGLQFQALSSHSTKRIIFMLGTQAVSPLVLIIINQLKSTRCYHTNCFQALTSYIFTTLYYKIFQTTLLGFRALYDHTKLKIKKSTGNSIRHKSKYWEINLFIEKESELQPRESGMTYLVDEVVDSAVLGFYGIAFPAVMILNTINCAIRMSIFRDLMIYSRRRPFSQFNLDSQVISRILKIMIILSIFTQSWICMFNSDLLLYYYFSFVTTSSNSLGFSSIRNIILQIQTVSFISVCIIIYGVVHLLQTFHQSSGNKKLLITRDQQLLQKHVIDKGKSQNQKKDDKMLCVLKIFRVGFAGNGDKKTD